MSDQPKLNVDAYLARIGYSGLRTATLATLQELHALHPAAIPFENLDALLRRPVGLDVGSLATKLIQGRRGGYCYEQNTLFQAALQALGFSVGSLAARVQWGRPEGALSPRIHMLLRVHLPEGDFIADVGFGRLTLTAPVRLEADTAQPTPHGLYRLIRVRDELRLETKLSQGWAAVYQIALQEQTSADWEVAHWYNSTHPESRFTTALMVARPVGDRRLGLLNNVLSTHHQDGTSEQTVIDTPQALEATLRGDFDLNLPEEGKSPLVKLLAGS
jgi:N-hydroxyarylamine O-acetyltransferase